MLTRWRKAKGLSYWFLEPGPFVVKAPKAQACVSGSRQIKDTSTKAHAVLAKRPLDDRHKLPLDVHGRHTTLPTATSSALFALVLGESSPTKINQKEKSGYPYSNLSTGGPRLGKARPSSPHGAQWLPKRHHWKAWASAPKPTQQAIRANIPYPWLLLANMLHACLL